MALISAWTHTRRSATYLRTPRHCYHGSRCRCSCILSRIFRGKLENIPASYLMISFAHGEFVERIASVENGLPIVDIQRRVQGLYSSGRQYFLVVHGSHSKLAQS